MPTKQAIIDNIEQYTAPMLVEYIKAGIVTLDELKREAAEYFPVKVRREVERLLAGSEEEDWQKAVAEDTEESLTRFINAYPGSTHVEEARAEIRRIHNLRIDEDARDAWDNLDKDSIEDLQSYLRDNPDSPHSIEARKLINDLQREEYLGFDLDALVARIHDIQTDKSVYDPDAVIVNEIKGYTDRGKITHDDLLEMIRRDNNILRSSALKLLVEAGYLQLSDFGKIGIDRRFVEHLVRGEAKQPFSLPKQLEKINKVSTEIYFWGIPSSGKSCALGAIMSVANNGKVARSMSKDPDCQGYGYMTRLSHLFKSDGKVGTLPEGTSIYSTYEMGFDLEDEKGLSHPITCIDLAGELVRCMYKSDAGEPLTDDELNALDTLTSVLIDNRTVNRKIHFFVLEYGGEDRKYEGLSQTEYLESALRYIERTRIFEKDTDAIYLMLTKVDKTGAVGQNLVSVLTDYIDDNYRGFYQGLESICRKNEINGGRVERVPFSLGSVCFQDFCLFNETPAANVVKKLLTRSKGFKTGKTSRILGMFKK